MNTYHLKVFPRFLTIESGLDVERVLIAACERLKDWRAVWTTGERMFYTYLWLEVPAESITEAISMCIAAVEDGSIIVLSAEQVPERGTWYEASTHQAWWPELGPKPYWVLREEQEFERSLEMPDVVPTPRFAVPSVLSGDVLSEELGW